MDIETEPSGLSAALSMRARSAMMRLLIMAAIAGLLWTMTDWSIAPVWWLSYAALQWTSLRLFREHNDAQRPIVYLLAAVSYTVAGLPAWHLWVNVGNLGIAAATMFLCGMLVQLVVSSLDAGRLFWASATPLIIYLIAVPPLAFGFQRLEEGLTVSACAIMLTSYLTVLWRGQRRALGEIRQSRMRAEASRREAEAASQAKTDFLATMSHELRTPMNAVLGAADLLGRTELNDEQKDHLAMLADGGAILMHVLNDVLDLSKIEAGKLLIDPSRIDIHSFVRRCAALWAPRADDKGLEFSLTVGPDVPQFVVMDATRIGQIVFNLISNALKFTEAGQIRLRLESREVEDGRVELVLSVEDTGIGMSEDTLARLFTAFSQADASFARRYGGTGLGLSISQKLAAMMGGEITATSVQGQGATFTLRFLADVAEGVDSDGADPEETIESERPSIRILVAEDNPANQRIIDHFLRPIGADVTIAGDGEQALAALAVGRFDLVLMDVQMPVMDGLEATRRLRASGGVNAGIPVLALTANVMDAQKRACVEAGMTGHIAKPIDARLLLTSVINAYNASLGADEPVSEVGAAA